MAPGRCLASRSSPWLQFDSPLGQSIEVAGPLARVRARALVARAPLIGALVAFVVCCAGTAPAAAETTVSLSFDDGSADQMAAKQILADHGLHGTFFIIPGRVGTTRFLSWADLASIYADGSEIGGHTATHRDLTTLPPDQQRDEICGGRQELLAHGFPQLSFAYPFGHYGSTSEALVEACGYLSGRTSGALAKSPAESIPPVNRWAL